MSRSIVFTISMLLFLALLVSTGSVLAMWQYTRDDLHDSITAFDPHLNEFTYDVTPEAEVSLLQRLYDLLNNLYTNEKIEAINLANGYHTSRECLLTTLDKNWDAGSISTNGSFVGNMDPTENSQMRLDALFGDILSASGVSFILKSEDLIGDWVHEISLYSTSDTLDWTPGHEGYVVGVHLSVFAPILDEWYNVLGYELLCDSVHGYCQEVAYVNDREDIPSFSTETWRDTLYYWHEAYADAQPILAPDRYRYDIYHAHYYAYEGQTIFWMGYIEISAGDTARQYLYKLFYP